MVEHDKGPLGTWGPDGSPSTNGKRIALVFRIVGMGLKLNTHFFGTWWTDQLRQGRMVAGLDVQVVFMTKCT